MTQVSNKTGTQAPEEGFEPTSARTLTSESSSHISGTLNTLPVPYTNPQPNSPHCVASEPGDPPGHCDLFASSEQKQKCAGACFFAGMAPAPAASMPGLQEVCARVGCGKLRGDHIVGPRALWCPNRPRAWGGEFLERPIVTPLGNLNDVMADAREAFVARPAAISDGTLRDLRTSHLVRLMASLLATSSNRADRAVAREGFARAEMLQSAAEVSAQRCGVSDGEPLHRLGCTCTLLQEIGEVR